MKVTNKFDNILEQTDIKVGDSFSIKTGHGEWAWKKAIRIDSTFVYYRDKHSFSDERVRHEYAYKKK